MPTNRKAVMNQPVKSFYFYFQNMNAIISQSVQLNKTNKLSKSSVSCIQISTDITYWLSLLPKGQAQNKGKSCFPECRLRENKIPSRALDHFRRNEFDGSAQTFDFQRQRSTSGQRCQTFLFVDGAAKISQSVCASINYFFFL